MLDPVRENTIRELLSQQEPERWIDYITIYGRGRIIITGYGSFGGTTLTKEIVESVNHELARTSGAETLLAFRFDLVKSTEEEAIFIASVQEPEQDIFVGQVTTMDQDEIPGTYWVKTLLDVLDDLVSGKPGKSDPRKAMEQAIGAKTVSSRLALVVDKAPDLRTLDIFINHPLLERPSVSYLVIVERERYDQWDERTKRALKRRRKFQVWNVPCLWETEHRLVDRIMELLFSGFRLDSPEAEEISHAFRKHIAFVGRGAMGRTLSELQQLKYWRFDEDTKQAFIAFESLDHELIRHNAWIQDTLEANWGRILGTNFPGWERTDRAKQGVYALMDWITDYATFALEEILAAAEQTPVIISPHKRLRDEVVFRLLEVLVESAYLQRVEDEFDIIWGRDVTEDGVRLVSRVTHADEIASLKERTGTLEARLEDLLAEHKAASSQLSSALSEISRTRLKRQIESLEQEISQVENELSLLRRTHGMDSKEETSARTSEGSE